MGWIERSIYIIVILIVSIISFLLSSKYSDLLSIESIDCAGLLERVKENRMLEHYSEDYSLNKNSFLCNESKDTISLKDISEEGQLVLYFNPHGCGVCHDELFKLMKRELNADKINITIISSSEGYRDLLVQVAVNEGDFTTMYSIENMGIPLCDEGVSFFFWLDSDYSAKHVFIPERDHPIYTIEYFALAQNKFTLKSE